MTESGADGPDAGGAGGVGVGGETMVVNREGGGVLIDVGCFCLTNFVIRSGIGGRVCGISGTGGGGGGGLGVAITGSSGGAGIGTGAGAGDGTGEVSGGAPGGAVGKLAAAFFTSLFADFSAPDAFSTG